jgi:aspartate-semialdehyde dehydrogenase
MVGSVLLERMRAEGDLEGIEARFFSTSNAGGAAPPEAADGLLQDAFDIGRLQDCEVVLTCQGGTYTSGVFEPLRSSGWEGYWIDAASALRLRDDSTLVLDPINGDQIRERLHGGCRTFVGANCTVGLLLMAIGGLYRSGLVEWVSTMTYQAVSGAGARKLTELARQIRCISTPGLDLTGRTSVEVERAVTRVQRSASLPVDEIGAPLACNVLPWIDSAMDDGQTREEWKAAVEATKILGADPPVRIDGTCARVDAMRCHSQALCIKLVRDLPLGEAQEIVRGGNAWVRLVDNSKEATLRQLTPAAVSGSLQVAVGRMRKLNLGPSYLGAFTVGDQLLWGAAEPLRRMLLILREHLS